MIMWSRKVIYKGPEGADGPPQVLYILYIKMFVFHDLEFWIYTDSQTPSLVLDGLVYSSNFTSSF